MLHWVKRVVVKAGDQPYHTIMHLVIMSLLIACLALGVYQMQTTGRQNDLIREQNSILREQNAALLQVLERAAVNKK